MARPWQCTRVLAMDQPSSCFTGMLSRRDPFSVNCRNRVADQRKCRTQQESAILASEECGESRTRMDERSIDAEDPERDGVASSRRWLQCSPNARTMAVPA